MEKEEILRYILPEEFIEYFDLKGIDSLHDRLLFTLDEKYIFPDGYNDNELESKGFTPTNDLTDFPIRDRRVILRVRRRKWKDRKTSKTYTRNLDIKAEETSYTKEFASF